MDTVLLLALFVLKETIESEYLRIKIKMKESSCQHARKNKTEDALNQDTRNHKDLFIYILDMID